MKHFIVTHRPPQGGLDGPVEFVFVTDGVAAAVELAREAAGDRYVTVGGGGDIARQCLAAGLVDDVQLHVVPVVLGVGVPLFASLETGFRLTKTRASMALWLRTSAIGSVHPTPERPVGC